MSNVIDIDVSRNQVLVTEGLKKLKDFMIPLCQVEEQQFFAKGLGSSVSKSTKMKRVKYVRNTEREDECAMGMRYFDALEVLRTTFVRIFWMEAAGLDSIPEEGVDGVRITGNRTDRRGDRLITQDIKFTADWRKELGFDMICRISVKITSTAPIEMTVDYVRDYPVAE